MTHLILSIVFAPHYHNNHILGIYGFSAWPIIGSDIQQFPIIVINLWSHLISRPQHYLIGETPQVLAYKSAK